MAGVRDLKRRIRSITSMQQITKAMKMVAVSRLRRSQEKVVASRPYARQIKDVTARLLRAQPEETENALLAQRPVRKKLYVLITADRGLCGGYNANLIRAMLGIIKEKEDAAPIALIAVGRRGRDYFLRIKSEIVAEFTGLGDSPSYAQARKIAQEVVRLYESGEVDEVNLLYSRFVSVLSQVPTVIRLLPVESETERSCGDYIFEPSPQYILEHLLPRYIDTLIYSALLESKASEQGAKMTAMDAATENAKAMIDTYTLAMNRARQAAITKEISEIVGGAAALE